MANISEVSIYDIQEMMGDAASKDDAECMMAILSRECVADTEDVPESKWLKWCEEACARAANEAFND